MRADVVRRRAAGRSWEAVGSALGFDPDALRRDATADPLFAAAVDEAVAEAEREAELAALARLKQLTASENERVALKASEVLVRYARERRRERDDTARPSVEPRAAAEAAKTTPRPAAVASPRPGRVPSPKPTGAFRAVPDLSPDRLAELVRGG